MTETWVPKKCAAFFLVKLDIASVVLGVAS